MNNKTKERIEELVGLAYELGFAHGGNTLRLGKGESPDRADEGWSKYFEEIIKTIEAQDQK